MPYTQTVWQDGVTVGNQTHLNNIESQYSEAMQSFNQDLLSAFVESGLVVTRHNSYASNVLGSTPLQYFRLDETSGTNAFDSSGNGQAGTYVASPTLNAAGLLTGDPDAAVTLNGTTQYVSIPTTNLPTGANPWTIEAWAKPTSGTGNGVVCSFGDAGSNGRVAVLAQLSSGAWQTWTWGGTVVSGGTSAAGVKHHVVSTFDGTSLRLYVDGALVAGPTAPGVTVNVSGTHAAIGALYNASYGSFFGGTLDECAIYGSALSGATITAHYNAGSTAVTQVDMTSGVVVPVQSDSTTRRRAISSASFTTVTPSTTYYLYAQPDGTTYWNTANTPAANSLAIAQVTTDGSGNVSLVTDKRTLVAKVLPNATGGVSFPAIGGQATAGAFGVPVIVAQAIQFNITSTAAQQTIVSFTPSTTGFYELLAYVYVSSSGGGTRVITVFGYWTDPLLGFNDAPFLNNGFTPVTIASNQSVNAPGGYPMTPMVVYALAGMPISVKYTDATTSPNDYITAMIRRLT